MAKYNTILALDTALNGISIGICSPDMADCYVSQTEMERGQAENLLPVIQAAMDETGIVFSDLDSVLTTYGPGAFAGLRIGLSTARALSVALDVPIYGLSTFAAMALTYQQNNKIKSPFCIVLETKRQDFYAQVFDENLQPLTQGVAAPAEVIKDHLATYDVHTLVGNAGDRLLSVYDDVKAKTIEITLSDMGVCGDLFLNNPKNIVFQSDPQPLYLRDADVSYPKKPYRMLESTSSI